MKSASALFALDGARIVVTGAGSGIGAALLEHFASCGARLAGLDLRQPQQRSAPPGTHWFACDVGDSGAIRDALDAAAAALGGGIDVLINNAGVIHPPAALVDTDPAWLERVLRTNLLGTLHGIQYGAPHVVDGGSIINTSSMNAVMGLAGAGPYSASKAAVVSLTRTAAVELGGTRGIRVNAVLPTLVRTPMTGERGPAHRVAEILAPLGRYAEVDDLLGAFHFLASPASRYITGQSLVIDGGTTAGLSLAALAALAGSDTAGGSETAGASETPGG
jgi:NAD(P)-dependent dehydrogenase (short-subunit alcohol dehydrogenase family)